MKLILLIFSAISLFVTPLQLSAQTKRALVIGLGEQKDKSWGKINGDKDISYVEAMLLGVGYKEITTLVNQQATKVRIVNEFQKLASRCRMGDIVYIHFSGHGQHVTDVDGDEPDGDGWDESWIPYDAYAKYGRKDKGDKHLIDDEVNVLLTAIKDNIGDAGKLLLVVDACYSGGSDRAPKGETVRGADDKFRIPIKPAPKPKEEPRNVGGRWLTLSACEEYQSAMEMKRPQIGKLTYALYDLSKKGTVSFHAIESFMNLPEIKNDELEQNPVLTGETETSKLSDFLDNGNN